MISWLRRQPDAGQASACERCHVALGRAASFEAKSRQAFGELASRAGAEGGELWEADGAAYWFAPESTTTPTRANVRRVEVALEATATVATT
jgi:hypothetical protein